jgi:flagellar hook-associated protein 3 FlgL
MNPILNPVSAIFVSNVDRIQLTLAQANGQISSGKQISQPSDAPDQIDSLLQLRADRQRNTQIQANLGLAKTEAQSADSAISSAISLMDRAVELATQGATATQTADSRAAIAPEVQSLLEQMVSYSNTQVQGRYIFGGDQDSSPVYQLDLNNPANPTGAIQLTNTTATRQIEDPAGGTFAASKGAQEIFGDMTTVTNPDGSTSTVPAQDNVFAALNGLLTALQSNNQDGITNSIDTLKTASAHLNNMDSFYGTVETRVQDASNFSSNYDTQLQTEIGQKEDADVTSAALSVSQANTNLQAAFMAQGKMPTTTLFNFLA